MLRVESRTSALAARLQPGDIAVVDLVDLDAATAHVLVARKVAAVVNASPSTSGRYPNLGPSVLVAAGVPLLDDVGSHVLTDLRDGRAARLDGDTLWVDDERVACGARHDEQTVSESGALARAGTAAQLAGLTANAAGFLLEEKDLLLEGLGVPALSPSPVGRPVVVVGPAYGAQEDLRSLRRFVHRRRPFLVGVDGGADVLLATGLRPDLVVGDAATMGDEALRAAGQVVLRADDGGLDRVHDLAVPVTLFSTRAATEDMALLLVREAELVVLTGVPRTLEELLDRGRQAAASSLLTRFALGPKLVAPAAAVQWLPRRSWALPALCLILTGLLAGSVAVGHEAIADLWHQLAG